MSLQLITKYRKGFAALLIVAAFISSMIILTQRVRMEKQSNTVEIVMDYRDLEDMCLQEHLEVGAVLSKMKEAGLNSVAFGETTLDEMQERGEITWVSGSELLNVFNIAGGDMSERPSIKPGSICILNCRPEIEKELKNNLNLLWGPGSYDFLEMELPDGRNLHIMQIHGKLRDMPYMGIGFNRELIEKVRRMGFGIVLRPENRNQLKADTIREYFTHMSQIPGVTTLIFSGVNEAPGYPDFLDSTVDGFKKAGFAFGDVEVPNDRARQKGTQYIGLKIPDQTVRVQSITPLYLAKMSPLDAVDKFRLGVRERNIRMVYLRPYPVGFEGKDIFETNLGYISGIRDEIKIFGYHTGKASRLPAYQPPAFLAVLIALGACGIFLLTLDFVYFDRGGIALFVFTATLILSSALAFSGRLPVLQKLTGLGLGILFPVYAFTAFFEEMGMVNRGKRLTDVLGYAVTVLLKITAITILGGLMMAAVMSSTSFMLSLDKFRGVKALLVLPPLLILLTYYLKGADRRIDFAELMKTPIYVWQAVVTAVIGVIGLVILLRSGNASPSAVSGGEQTMRVAMERILWVRPRFKEFMLGHPALMITWALSYMGRYRGLGIFVLLASVGPSDIMDSFAHVHTPVFITLIRSLSGGFFGLLAGLLAVTALWFYFNKTAALTAEKNPS